MIRNDKTHEYFNREAKDFDASYKNSKGLKDFIRRISYFYNKKAIVGRLEALLSLMGEDISGKNILEVGCGPGIYSIRLAQRGAVVTANDYAQTMLDIATANAKANHAEIDFILGDFFDFHPNHKFDTVFATGVIDYIPPTRALAFLKHMADLSNHFVIVSFPKKYGLHALVRKLWLTWIKRIPVTFFSNQDIETAASACCLKEVERKDVGILWVVKFRKGSENEREPLKTSMGLSKAIHAKYS
jgi:2-polyprenyl-3-methyl-5-hydroxy-6-metoxy-1,4-benzoquinol methylase